MSTHYTNTEKGIMINIPLPNHVIDNDGVRVLQKAGQFHGNLREPHARTAEDLNRFGKQKRSNFDMMKVKFSFYFASPQASKHKKTQHMRHI